MQNEQFDTWARRNSICVALLVAKFHERSFIVELFDDSTDLSARKSLRRKVCQQCHNAQD
jgi:hypothetical protein